MDMGPVLTQMGILVLIMAVGFVCTKIGVTDQEFTRSSSKVVLNVFLVFTILNSVTTAELELSFSELGADMLIYCVMLIIPAIIGLLGAKLLRMDAARGGIAAFSVCFTNTVFVGFPLVEAVYGAEGLLLATISNIPYNIIVYTLGIAMIDGDVKSMNIKNALSAPLISTVIAVGFFMTGWKLPGPVIECLDVISGGTVPVSMLIVGSSLGAMSIKKALGDWRVYMVCFLKLIIAPVVCFFVLKPFVHDEILLGVIVILSACPTATLATILAIRSGKDEAYASQCVFASTVFSAVTIPLMIWLLL